MVGYFRRLWSGAAPLGQVFWQDMMIVGTAISVVATLAAMASLALGVSAAAAGAIFVAPVPYNIFLVIAVWRTADRARSDWSWPAKIGALLWLIGVFII